MNYSKQILHTSLHLLLLVNHKFYMLSPWLINSWNSGDSHDTNCGHITVKSQTKKPDQSPDHILCKTMWNGYWMLWYVVVFCEASCTQSDVTLPWHTSMNSKSPSLPLILHSWTPQIGLHRRSMDWICSCSTIASHSFHKLKLSSECVCPGLGFLLLKSRISHIRLYGLLHSLVRIFRY